MQAQPPLWPHQRSCAGLLDQPGGGTAMPSRVSLMVISTSGPAFPVLVVTCPPGGVCRRPAEATRHDRDHSRDRLNPSPRPIARAPGRRAYWITVIRP